MLQCSDGSGYSLARIGWGQKVHILGTIGYTFCGRHPIYGSGIPGYTSCGNYSNRSQLPEGMSLCKVCQRCYICAFCEYHNKCRGDPQKPDYCYLPREKGELY